MNKNINKNKKYNGGFLQFIGGITAKKIGQPIAEGIEVILLIISPIIFIILLLAVIVFLDQLNDAMNYYARTAKWAARM